MKIEFFHDVLCAWCYAYSPKVRRLSQEFPWLKITHRCFALVPTQNSIVEMFGSHEAGKLEILEHWKAANELDDEKRICADDMACKNFNFPYSMPGLLACKAAEIQGGSKKHWDMFDRIQKAHFTETLDISRFDVLLGCAKDVGLDLRQFNSDFNSTGTKAMVESDIERAEELGVFIVPSLVLNEDVVINGSQDYETLKKLIEENLN